MIHFNRKIKRLHKPIAFTQQILHYLLLIYIYICCFSQKLSFKWGGGSESPTVWKKKKKRDWVEIITVRRKEHRMHKWKSVLVDPHTEHKERAQSERGPQETVLGRRQVWERCSLWRPCGDGKSRCVVGWGRDSSPARSKKTPKSKMTHDPILQYPEPPKWEDTYRKKFWRCYTSE